jgi:DNA (cytosine-5)-methyltransferase 1
LSNNIYILLNIFALFTKKDYNIFTVKGVCMSKQPKNTRLESVLPINTNKKIQTSLSFDDFVPKNVELFAGAGGFGAGAILAGLEFDIAINHNPAALAVHKVNFPHTTQMINDVFEHNPIDVLIASGVPLHIFNKIRNWRSGVLKHFAVHHLHLSPDCTFHSRAKGKKKVLARHASCGDDCSLVDHSQLSQDTADRIRGLAWVGIGWAVVARPQRITLENVIEFLEWGPTTIDKDGDVIPDASRAGETFEAFKGILSTGIDKRHPAIKEMRKFLKPFLGDDYNEEELINGLGYDVEFKELTACDYGAPTSRKRLFMIARCDGVKINWPKPTHADPSSQEVKQGKLLPYRSAAECINWDVAAPSIFETKEEIKVAYGIRVKRPLVDNSMRRIAYGMKKFVIETDDPYIVNVTDGNKNATPYIQTYYGEINNNKKTIRKITKTEAVRMVGNSVPPHFATAIINALEEENHEDEGTIEEKAS